MLLRYIIIICCHYHVQTISILLSNYNGSLVPCTSTNSMSDQTKGSGQTVQSAAHLCVMVCFVPLIPACVTCSTISDPD